MADVPLLPDHLIEEIFTFLPSKSVGRCRCLSRAWSAALSSSSDFARRHFRAANRRRGSGQLLLLGTTADAGAPPLPQQLAAIPRALADLAPLCIVTQQCRGLVILQSITMGNHYVCNPSTGQTMALPPDPLAGNSSSRHDQPSLGLAYDESTGEHTIVRVYGGQHWDTSGPVDVYVPATGVWRRSSSRKKNPPSPEYGHLQIDQDVPSVSVKGRIYWLAHRRTHGPLKETIIISYSIRDDTLRTVPTPRAMGEFSWLYRHSLVELGGELCLFSPTRDSARPKWQFSIWRLVDEHGGADDQWELRCRVGLPTVPAPEKGGWIESVVWPVVPSVNYVDDEVEEEEDGGVLVFVQSLTVVSYADEEGGNGERRRAGSARVLLPCSSRTKMPEDDLGISKMKMTEEVFRVSGFFLTGAALCQESLVSPPGLCM